MLPVTHHADETAILHVAEPPLGQHRVHTMPASVHEGLSSFRCNCAGGCYAVGKSRASKVMAKALRAGFQRFIQRWRPVPVGSSLRITR
jgi:hypothetical protein